MRGKPDTDLSPYDWQTVASKGLMLTGNALILAGHVPEGIAPHRAAVDAACVAAGRDPADVERTVAVMVQFEGGRGRQQGDYATAGPPPVPVDRLAEMLRALRREGITHAQLVLDPITVDSIEALAPVLAELDTPA